MTQRAISLAATVVLALGLAATPASGQEDTHLTGAGAGVYPPDTSYAGVPLSGLKFGIGVIIAPSGGTAEGHFQTTLLGTSLLGEPQDIVVEGKATGGSSTGATTATFSGTASVDLGNGTPPLTGVPFTVAVVTNAEGQGTLTIVLGTTNLPSANVNEGNLTIK